MGWGSTTPPGSPDSTCGVYCGVLLSPWMDSEVRLVDGDLGEIDSNAFLSTFGPYIV